MSYKKLIYKYKYLKAEVDEVEEKLNKYVIEFNKLFISREKYEKMKNNPDAAPIIEEPKPKPKEIINEPDFDKMTDEEIESWIVNQE